MGCEPRRRRQPWPGSMGGGRIADYRRPRRLIQKQGIPLRFAGLPPPYPEAAERPAPPPGQTNRRFFGRFTLKWSGDHARRRPRSRHPAPARGPAHGTRAHRRNPRRRSHRRLFQHASHPPPRPHDTPGRTQRTPRHGDPRSPRTRHRPRRYPAQPSEITHGPRTQPSRVALTFHGQGDPAVAESLLGEAEKAGAHVTVLAVGSWLDEHPGLARRILDGGHDLGNHTLRHLDINAMSPTEAAAEIRGCADRLKRLTGSIGTWFRPSRSPRASPWSNASPATRATRTRSPTTSTPSTTPRREPPRSPARSSPKSAPAPS